LVAVETRDYFASSGRFNQIRLLDHQLKRLLGCYHLGLEVDRLKGRTLRIDVVAWVNSFEQVVQFGLV